MGEIDPPAGWAHPRSRGENTDLHSISGGPEGSSPLTRGKRPLQNGLRRPLGLIPAHAGKTPSTSRATACVMGSSPLTRGKLRCCERLRIKYGLIPAHAGKTEGERARYADDGAHPRSRGENRAPPFLPPRRAGSSPLTRGKHCEEVPDRLGAGLIPAHAGKTLRAGRVQGHLERLIPAHAGKTARR